MTAARTGFSRRSSPAFHVGPLAWEPSPEDPTTGFNSVPPGGWRCFHCGDVFYRADHARRHFGVTPAEIPSCLEQATA